MANTPQAQSAPGCFATTRRSTASHVALIESECPMPSIRRAMQAWVIASGTLSAAWAGPIPGAYQTFAVLGA